MISVQLLVIALMSQAASPAATNRLSRLELSAQERRQIVAAVESSAFDTPDSWEEELSVTQVDLGDGPGIVLRGTKMLCGATGNCQLFVVRKLNGAWVSLFEGAQAPLAESYELGPGVTDGIKDLTVTTNTGAQSSERIRYRFDRHVYRPSGSRVSQFTSRSRTAGSARRRAG